jgi:mycothiol synthase
MKTRRFETESDLDAMLHLLVAGRLAAASTYYIHPGDLTWWFTYFTLQEDPRQYTTLWESPAAPGGLAGWALYSPAWFALDVYIHPDLAGSPLAAEIWQQAEEDCAAQRRQVGRKTLSTVWICESDAWTVAHLLQRGFAPTPEYMDILVCSLDEPLPAPALPEGYTFDIPRPGKSAHLRAAAQHAAFGSSLPLEVYTARYARFLAHPRYPAGFDRMITAPDGRCAAFTITWPERVTRQGLLEPVGVDPDFQRQGLGRAVVLESLHYLQKSGMESAMVCGLSSLPTARSFYASLGFQAVRRVRTYEKELC